MTGDKKHSDKAIVVELKVSMHCKACERLVLKILRKFKGVEKVSTDMKNNKAVVVGKVEPQKVLKKLRKKTGKKVEIVVKKEEATGNAEGNKDAKGRECSKLSLTERYLVFDGLEDELVLDLEMFSDENPNACSIM